MRWIVDDLPDRALLNTAGWRYIVPQLYRQYPNDDLKLDISVSSLPIVRVSDQDVGTTVFLDITIDVLDAGEVIPVACISMVCLNKDLKLKLMCLTGKRHCGWYTLYVVTPCIAILFFNILIKLYEFLL